LIGVEAESTAAAAVVAVAAAASLEEERKDGFQSCWGCSYEDVQQSLNAGV